MVGIVTKGKICLFSFCFGLGLRSFLFSTFTSERVHSPANVMKFSIFSLNISLQEFVLRACPLKQPFFTLGG